MGAVIGNLFLLVIVGSASALMIFGVTLLVKKMIYEIVRLDRETKRLKGL